MNLFLVIIMEDFYAKNFHWEKPKRAFEKKFLPTGKERGCTK